VKEGESYTSNEDYQTYVAQNNAEIFNDILNMATGQYSHAEGTMTEAHGNYSHAEGNRTFASGDYSHAEGGYTVASGTYSHAEGGNAIASGMYSHAEGDCTEASGENSHAEGRYTVAAGECQHVQGKYNIPDPDNKYAHIVGNGSYNFGGNDVSNAHTLDWNGNAWFAGDVYIGPNNEILVTKAYVDEAIANASLGNGSDVSDSGVIEDSEFDDLISGTFGPEYVNREE
jgi:hypothetical protein